MVKVVAVTAPVFVKVPAPAVMVVAKVVLPNTAVPVAFPVMVATEFPAPVAPTAPVIVPVLPAPPVRVRIVPVTLLEVKVAVPVSVTVPPLKSIVKLPLLVFQV
jgi:hypothetical protein